MKKLNQQQNKENELISIDSDDDNENYLAFKEFLDEHTERNKNKIAEEFENMGRQLLVEIERKKKIHKDKKEKMIPYILKHCEEKYDENDLLKYSFDDVTEIYNEYKEMKMNPIIKFFKFLFNL